MIKRLRLRFILLSMLAVMAVLTTLMLIINIANYASVRREADGILRLLSNGDGQFVIQPPDTGDPQDWITSDTPRHKPDNGVNPETPYETRFFTVRYQEGVVTANVRQIAAISEPAAIAMAEELLAAGKGSGYHDVYRYLVTGEDGNRLVLFMDCTRQIKTADNFLLVSILVSLAGLCAFGLLIVLLSGRVVRPIAESYEKQKRFITDAGHELKTPLTIISANNELTEMVTGETESTRAIARQVSRMSAMVKNLSALAKLDEMRTQDGKAPFSLSDAILDTVQLFEPVLTRNERRLTTAIAEGIQYVGDEGLIRQLVSLYLDNAAKYALTHISVTLASTGGNIVLTVSNDASGIRRGNLKRCFERFYRADETRASHVDGSGIGLSLAMEIVKLHHGEVSATGSDSGEFTVRTVL